MKADPRTYRLSPLAETDLEDIWTYTARTWSIAQADRYTTDIIDAVECLATGERRGRDASDIRAGYLRYAIGRHILFYRCTAKQLDVIRILHQRMDVEEQL